jgi:heterodisulfide reductase subunit A-like polyferredoxin
LKEGDQLGGQALKIHKTWQGEDVQENLRRMIAEVKADKNIDIFTGSEIIKVDGFVGNFKTTIQMADERHRNSRCNFETSELKVRFMVNLCEDRSKQIEHEIQDKTGK